MNLLEFFCPEIIPNCTSFHWSSSWWRGGCVCRGRGWPLRAGYGRGSWPADGVWLAREWREYDWTLYGRSVSCWLVWRRMPVCGCLGVNSWGITLITLIYNIVNSLRYAVDTYKPASNVIQPNPLPLRTLIHNPIGIITSTSKLHPESSLPTLS